MPDTDIPGLYLPPLFTNYQIESLLLDLGLPEPDTIRCYGGRAQYHSIYFLNFNPVFWELLKPATAQTTVASNGLVLRVSGKHLPRIKTINEVAVMQWVRENTTIPVPAVLHYDASEDNALGHEFILMEKVGGIPFEEVWDSQEMETKKSLVSQVADFMVQLHAQPFESIGGMQFSETDGSVVPGPVVDEDSWQAPDLATYWTPEDSSSKLNISGPYESYTALCAAKIECAIYAIERHHSLAWIPHVVMTRLRAFVDMLRNNQEKVRDLKLNDGKIVLAHCGLHFGNLMFHPVTKKITAVLD